MHVIEVKDVNQALAEGLAYIRDHGVARDSRNGPVLEAPTPVTTVYKNPRHRVLFSSKRDCNHTFHLMESLWILAGRRDVGFLTQFNPRMADYSDDGVTLNGAYGHRLRRSLGVDQVAQAIKALREQPDTRRVVMQIWNGSFDLTTPRKDLPCNDLVMLKVRDGKLLMTVCCRSNDMLWGAYGANAVHFAFLHEYIAAAAGYEQGAYTQISDSFHVYTEGPGGTLYQKLSSAEGSADVNQTKFSYSEHKFHAQPLFEVGNDRERRAFDNDLEQFFSAYDKNPETFMDPGAVAAVSKLWESDFFKNVVFPLHLAWAHYKDPTKLNKGYALDHAIRAVSGLNVKFTDWSHATTHWYLRRLGKFYRSMK